MMKGRAIEKLHRLIEKSYHHYPHEPILGPLRDIFASKPIFISEFNSSFIIAVSKLLKFKTQVSKVVRNPGKKTRSFDLKGNEAIIELCRTAGATEYLSGDGCHDFINLKSLRNKV